MTSRLGQTRAPVSLGQDADVRAQALDALHRSLRLGPGPARPHWGRLLRAEPRPGGGHPHPRTVSIRHTECTSGTAEYMRMSVSCVMCHVSCVTVISGLLQ